MPVSFERRSLELTPAEWRALERLAADLGTCPPSGPTAGKPAWRTLIKRIADGELSVSRPE